jgi:hypothetical protein
MFELSTVKSRKTCMSSIPSSKTTSPATMSRVPTPLGARQTGPERLSITAATTAAT